jgi:two-component system, NtrC family, sensor histidine kinase HydH
MAENMAHSQLRRDGWNMVFFERVLTEGQNQSLWHNRGRFRFALWFALVSFLAIAANALVFSYAVSSKVEQDMLQRDANLSSQYLNSTVQLVGASSYFHGSSFNPQAPAMEAFFRQISGLPEVLGANVYSLDRQILWSSDRGQIGRRFASNDSLEAAFRGELLPQIETLNTSAASDEHVDFPVGLSQYIETYIPIWSDNGSTIVGAVEVYRSPVALLQDIASVKHTIWLGTALGALVLFATLIAIILLVRNILAEQERRIVETEKYAVVGELTSAVAHGLRNPLASIRSSAELALDDDISSNVRGALGDIVSQAERLESWIRSFLVQARDVPGALPAAVLLDDAIRDCLEGFAPQAKARGIVLEFCPQGESPRVKIKKAELCQVINSLIANSLEAIGRSGEVMVRRQDDGTGRVTLTIEDNGPGIAPEIAPRLFQSNATGKASGLGVGLSLTKRIVDRCGGSIELVNRSIRGARATLRLPAMGINVK